jgi:hypothetical protein
LALTLAAGAAHAQTTVFPSATEKGSDTGPFRYVLFTFDAPQPKAKGWQLGLAGDGTGSWAENGGDPVPVQVSPATLAVIAQAEPAVAAKHCETKNKNIAQTGKKSILFIAPSATCTFNFSDDDALNRAANTFLAIRETLRLGDELARLHRFDRLGLDAAMDTLEKESAAGFALEIANIAPVLQSIADDDRVMQRVRRRASHALEDAQHDSAK